MGVLNQSWLRRVTGAAALLVVLAGVSSGEQAGDDRAAFDRLKTLAGEWACTAKEGGEDGKTSDSVVTYQVTSGGHSLMEMLFCGTDHGMVTMYHMDHDDLVMTHYCALGNQPAMVVVPSDQADSITFEHIGGTNMGSENDPHMHKVVFTFLGPDHVRADWVLYRDGQEAGTTQLDLRRKKP